MIKINLLPPHMRENEVSFKRIFLWIGLGIFFMFVMSYISGAYRIASLQDDIKRNAEAYALLGQSMRRKAELDKSTAVIDEKNKILVNLSETNDSWYSILIHLSTLVTSGVWLEEVTSDANHMLLIKGNAANYQELTVFLKEFEQDTLFGAVVLRSSGMKKDNIADGEIVGFEILVQFRET